MVVPNLAEVSLLWENAPTTRRAGVGRRALRGLRRNGRLRDLREVAAR
jgi:hypothetical protein